MELGVSYIPWAKLKNDVDIELLEEGGMVDEDTMPDWLKNKMVESSPKKQPPVPSTETPSQEKGPGFIPLPDGTPVQSTGTPTTTVDTSQPPPIHTSGLLPPPPMSMPIVSPFSLNPRLLGPMGPHMSLPPGLMPNIPIGVPPPNIPGALMSNQLLGMGSPFAQAPPGMMPPMPMSGNGDKPPQPGLLPPPNMPPRDHTPVSEAMMSHSFGMHNPSMSMSVMSSEDNMDIEMEDAENKSDKPMPLSDQLLAAISGTSFNNSSNSADRFKNDMSSDIDDRNFGNNRDRDSRARDRNERNDRGRDNRQRRNSRDRGRDRDNRDGREGRDNRDRDRDREGGRNDRRGNRWSERDHRSGGREHRSGERGERDNEKKPDLVRNEKSLAERLRDMAHEGIVPNRPDRPSRDRSVEKPPANFGPGENQPPQLPLGDRPPFPLPKFPNGEPIMDQEVMERDIDQGSIDRSRLEREEMERMEQERRMDEHAWRDRIEPDMYRHPEEFNPIDEFDPRMRRHPEDFPRIDHPDFDPRMNRPDFEARRPHPYPEDMRMDEQYEFEMRQREMYERRDNFGRPDDMRMIDDFDPRARGPDFFPPRDGFGPRPLLRGPGPDGFPPRPLLGRPPGPPMFHPRGMGPRGPRPGMYQKYRVSYARSTIEEMWVLISNKSM